jgi:DNA-binding SARP family transcriptional activator
VEFRILGPLEVHAGGQSLPLPGPKPRAVLAILLLHANRPVSADRIAQALWGEDAPAGAANTVQVHVSRLRKALGETLALVTTAAGYELRLEPGQLDAHRLEAGLSEGRAALEAGRPESATNPLERALAEWRGQPLGDLAGVPFAERERARLEDLRVAAYEELVEARLALGRHAEVAGQLEVLIAEHPYRERLRGQLMLALYRSDRQADALQAYQHARRALAEELGLEPSERLRELERSILTHDPALTTPVAAAAAREPARTKAATAATDTGPARRLVSVVSAGVPDSGLRGHLDPEVMHALLDRFTDACGAVIERHGGRVESFADDAVVGVFGLGELHEDDALRAVRAAVELREAAEGLDGGPLVIRLGVESGEVFIGSGASAPPSPPARRSASPRVSGRPPQRARRCSESGFTRWSATPCSPSRSSARSRAVPTWCARGACGDCAGRARNARREARSSAASTSWPPCAPRSRAPATNARVT